MRRSRTLVGHLAILVAALTALAMASGVSPATATSEQTAAAKAVAGRMLAAPRSEALVKHLPVRVAVRVPARTSRLRVRVGRRNITARFRRARGSLRVANLTRGDGLRYGRNHLVVLAERRGGRPLIDTRSFVLARRDARLVQLRVRPGPVTSLTVQAARGATLAPEHFGRAREVERRLSVIRRERRARVWLNGRRVTRALDRSHPTRWTASLSAAQGLRYGVNRLRVVVAEPDRGRHVTLRRRFVVRRNRHLAAAGWDTATRLGGQVQLDGRRSRTAGGGRPHHHWRIVSKPHGSRAKLRRAGAARPLLTPDRLGRYVVGLTVTEGTTRATASQATGASTDMAVVTAGPESLLPPFKGSTVRDGKPGIQVGSQFYPNPSPNGRAMQWLTLDRRTLLPTGPKNSWLDGTGGGGNGIGQVASALANQDTNQLVILSYPSGNGPAPPVQKDQNGAFNDAMKTLGVGPISADILQDISKLVIVGIPHGGDGSGRYTHGGGPVDALTGWLMPDALKDDDGAFRFRLQPERPKFDTSSSSTPTTNTMTLRDQNIDAALPAGAAGGFQVTKLDPTDFTPLDHAVFATYGVADPASELVAMANFLNDNTRPLVAVQSIGHVPAPPMPNRSFESWWKASSALADYGANPHTFNTVNGSYAFLGGPRLEKNQVADSSSAIVLDPVENKHESGTLRGRASMRSDGYFMPLAADPTDSFEFSLYDTVFRSPTPWPYTPGGTFPQQEDCDPPGNDTAAYADALSFIATGIHLPATEWDVRSAYVKLDQSTWSDEKNNLQALKYKAGHGFDEAEFCNVSAQLQREFDWLDKTYTLFETYRKVLGTSGSLELADLRTIGTAIRTAVAADNTAEIGWTTGGVVGNLLSAALVLDPEGAAILAAWEGLVVMYELARELASEIGDRGTTPVGDQVANKVEELSGSVATHLTDTATALARVRDVIISDYGRLQELGTQIENTGADIDPPTMTARITSAASAFFSSELVPIPYGVHNLVWKVDHGITPGDFPDQCINGFQELWKGTPGSAQIGWMGDFARDRQVGHFPSLFVLGRHSLSIRKWGYPPKEVTDPMFTPSTQTIYGKRGYGMQLHRFMWEQYRKGFPPTDIYMCT